MLHGPWDLTKIDVAVAKNLGFKVLNNVYEFIQFSDGDFVTVLDPAHKSVVNLRRRACVIPEHVPQIDKHKPSEGDGCIIVEGVPDYLIEPLPRFSSDHALLSRLNTNELEYSLFVNANQYEVKRNGGSLISAPDLTQALWLVWLDHKGVDIYKECKS